MNGYVNEEEAMKPISLLLTSVFLGTIGQLCAKKGVMNIGQVYLNPSKIISIIFQFFSNPLILIGVFAYLIGSVIWLTALSRVELSFAYPFVSLTYVFVFIGSWFFFGETINLFRCLGLALIVCGVFFISLS